MRTLSEEAKKRRDKIFEDMKNSEYKYDIYLGIDPPSEEEKELRKNPKYKHIFETCLCSEIVLPMKSN